MKKNHSLVPGTLLIIYFGYLISLHFIGSSVGLGESFAALGLCALHGYNLYLQKTEQPDLKKEIDQLRLDLVKAHTKHKDETEKTFLKVQDEMGKISLAVGSKSPAAVAKPNDKKIIF
jgi:hypothetical protein